MEKKKYYKDNPDTKLAYQKKYNEEHKQQITDYKKKRDQTPERKAYMRKYMRNYYAKHNLTDDDNDFLLGFCSECRKNNVEIDLIEGICINCARRLNNGETKEDGI